MAKSENQKLKLFYIMQMLSEHTDEEHVISTKEIIERLASHDIKAERKSIYTDIQCLQDFGVDVMQKKGRGENGYYLASREFELAELKLLVDAVQASRFITAKKSRDLIKKLEKLTSRFQAHQLQRQVYVTGRVKTENEKIYYNVDSIYNAIEENVRISFQYTEWSLEKELVPKRKGARYQVSPWGLVWEDDNYYLVAYEESAGKIKHYRVDKMQDTRLRADKRTGQEHFENFNIAEYAKKTFGMYGGEEQWVTLKLPKKLFGVIMDRFGRETDVRVLKDGDIRVRIKAAVSGQFFGWLCGLGDTVSIQAPEDVKEQYRKWLKNVLKNQKKESEK